MDKTNWAVLAFALGAAGLPFETMDEFMGMGAYKRDSAATEVIHLFKHRATRQYARLTERTTAEAARQIQRARCLPVATGYCETCGHYGNDCTAEKVTA
jgi:hypothetical protein